MSTEIRIRGTAANIGEAWRYAFTARANGDADRAQAWEEIAGDLVTLGRGIARDDWKPESIESYAKKLYERWDRLLTK